MQPASWILITFSVFGFIGNSFVVYVFSRRKNKLTSTLFILALAGSDFIASVVTMPITVVHTERGGFLMYDFCCKLYTFLLTCNVPLSSFLMVAIAVDRYCCICHPFVLIVTPVRAKISIVCLCIFTCLLGSITAMGFGVLTDEDHLHDSNLTVTNAGNMTQQVNMTQVFDVIEYVSGDFIGLCTYTTDILSLKFIRIYKNVYSSFYLIAVVVVIIMYSLVYYSVSRNPQWNWRQTLAKEVTDTSQADDVEEHDLQELHELQPGVNTEEEDSELKQQDKKLQIDKEKRVLNLLANIRMAAMLFVVAVVFIVAFLPAWLMSYGIVEYNSIVYHMYFVYHITNPVIYAFMNSKFRKELKELFTKVSSCIR